MPRRTRDEFASLSTWRKVPMLAARRVLAVA